LTFLTILVEIMTGKLFGSMALLADGWHMGTHVAAFMIILYAYSYSRIQDDDQTFAVATGLFFGLHWLDFLIMLPEI
jgi:Co/Zn/Cd efflux system component